MKCIKNISLLLTMLVAASCTAGLEELIDGDVLGALSRNSNDREKSAETLLIESFPLGSDKKIFENYINRVDGICFEHVDSIECQYSSKYFMGAYVLGVRLHGKEFGTTWNIKVKTKENFITKYEVTATGPELTR